jgi:hypothetical protein
MTLEDILKMLTVGKPSIMEKAVVLCKFHRGLDNSTFADRFNFETWPQLVEWFGTEEYQRWDAEKCPVPIKLTRIKTGYTHRGFLELDAITAIQDYLEYRYKKTGSIMKTGAPLFINTKDNAITEMWISRLIPKLAVKSGIQKELKSYKIIRRNEKSSHELRDTLKSTLIVSGVVDWVCQMAIGHKVSDSYETQDRLFPQTARTEYAKASKKINILSNISHNMKGGEMEQSLKEQIAEMKQQNDLQEKGKNSLEIKMDEMQNDMKEMQFKYMQAKNQPMSDDEMERLANKMKNIQKD